MIIPYLFGYKTEKGMEKQEQEGYVSIGKAAELMGVSVVTVRRWTKNERFDIDWIRTLGKHRRFSLKGIRIFLDMEEENSRDTRIHVAYARVSGGGQKPDLVHQIATLKAQMPEDHLMISDIGSGLNYKKSGFNKLMNLILDNKVASLTVTYKDRLLRFGSDIIFKMCERMNTKIHVLYAPVVQTFEQELSTDILTLMTVFSAKLHGKRSHINKNKNKASVLA